MNRELERIRRMEATLDYGQYCNVKLVHLYIMEDNIDVPQKYCKNRICNLALLLLGDYPREVKAGSPTNLHTHISSSSI